MTFVDIQPRVAVAEVEMAMAMVMVAMEPKLALFTILLRFLSLSLLLSYLLLSLPSFRLLSLPLFQDLAKTADLVKVSPVALVQVLVLFSLLCRQPSGTHLEHSLFHAALNHPVMFPGLLTSSPSLCLLPARPVLQLPFSLTPL